MASVAASVTTSPRGHPCTGCAHDAALSVANNTVTSACLIAPRTERRRSNYRHTVRTRTRHSHKRNHSAVDTARCNRGARDTTPDRALRTRARHQRTRSPRATRREEPDRRTERSVRRRRRNRGCHVDRARRGIRNRREGRTWLAPVRNARRSPVATRRSHRGAHSTDRRRTTENRTAWRREVRRD